MNTATTPSTRLDDGISANGFLRAARGLTSTFPSSPPPLHQSKNQDIEEESPPSPPPKRRRVTGLPRKRAPVTSKQIEVNSGDAPRRWTAAEKGKGKLVELAAAADAEKGNASEVKQGGDGQSAETGVAYDRTTVVLFIKKIPNAATELDVETLVSHYARVDKIELPTKPRNGAKLGYAIVTVRPRREPESSKALLLALNNSSLLDRPIYAQVYTDRDDNQPKHEPSTAPQPSGKVSNGSTYVRGSTD
ncbi:uncharacterized protein JCM6883_007130 [Sporobolomyces salmoneus]|uniref:uncharacterized protein n=1 Tax=Sporobolomyces salmoneus TaxID=183962 RepID=UPI003176F0AA